MNKHIIALLLLCCLALNAQADTVQLREGHPERYVVVKGDTLWDISARFLKDPWRWPQVWQMNRAQIRNPHLIYPGDVVVLDMSSGEPRLRLLRETVRLQPQVRVEPLEKAAIPAISPSVIGPFLSQPLVVENDAVKKAPKIVASQDGNLLLAPNMNVYTDRIDDDSAARLQVYSPGAPLIDPVTKEQLGIEAKHLGDARVVRSGKPGTIHLTKVKQDINVGDRLMQAPEIALESFVPHAPDAAVEGSIIATYDGTSEVGRNAIVVINRGSRDGIETGHVLAVHQKGITLPAEKPAAGVRREGYINFERNADGSLKRDEAGRILVRTGIRNADGSVTEEPQPLKLPDERTGLLMVFRTFERVAYALVMESTRPINREDIVLNP